MFSIKLNTALYEYELKSNELLIVIISRSPSPSMSTISEQTNEESFINPKGLVIGLVNCGSVGLPIFSKYLKEEFKSVEYWYVE